jgi:NAD(P)-dependent dehydrogenase (short-subunit alcohol dehydrogenase family)
MADTTISVAIVTGAARGIGLAIANLFIARGEAVVLLDVDAAELEKSGGALVKQHADRVLPIACDVSDPQQVQRAVAQAEQRFGRIDHLVNNAGRAVFKPLVDTSFEEWRYVMATNLDGPFICSQACVPAMRRAGGGSIVNIASISGMRASTLRVAYGTSKAALIHFTKQQAVEFALFGIRANAVSPGPVETLMAKQVHSQAIRDAYHDSVPLGRYGSEEEIGQAVLFLCSPQASYVTGQVLAVDGGFDAAGVGIPDLRRHFGVE